MRVHGFLAKPFQLEAIEAALEGNIEEAGRRIVDLAWNGAAEPDLNRRPCRSKSHRFVGTGASRAAAVKRLQFVSLFAIMRRGTGYPFDPRAEYVTGRFSREEWMAIVRNIDVTMQSEVSFDDACRAAVTEAAKTLRGIMSFRVKEAECVVEHDKIIAYRVTGKIVFLVERWPTKVW
jgi:dodecin